MIVTIWRHGEAGSATSDRLRELTARACARLSFRALPPDYVAST